MDRLLVYENKYFKKISKKNNYSIIYLGTWCLENWQTENFLNVEPDLWANKNILVEDIQYIKNFTIRILRNIKEHILRLHITMALLRVLVDLLM